MTCDCDKTGRVLVNYILDESGSMTTCRDAAISSFNEYAGDLRNDENEVLLSLTKFQNEVEVVHTLVQMADVPDLCEHTYRPGGVTALYDAIGTTISKIEKDVRKNDRVLCVIMTDGAENASKEYTQRQIFDLISKKEKEGNWTFVYLGANQDSFSAGGALGIQVGNIINYQSTSHGHSHAMRRVRSATTAYAASGMLATQDFFADTKADEDDGPTQDVHLKSHSHTISTNDVHSSS